MYMSHQKDKHNVKYRVDENIAHQTHGYSSVKSEPIFKIFFHWKTFRLICNKVVIKDPTI